MVSWQLRNGETVIDTQHLEALLDWCVEREKFGNLKTRDFPPVNHAVYNAFIVKKRMGNSNFYWLRKDWRARWTVQFPNLPLPPAAPAKPKRDLAFNLAVAVLDFVGSRGYTFLWYDGFYRLRERVSHNEIAAFETITAAIQYFYRALVDAMPSDHYGFRLFQEYRQPFAGQFDEYNDNKFIDFYWSWQYIFEDKEVAAAYFMEQVAVLRDEWHQPDPAIITIRRLVMEENT